MQIKNRKTLKPIYWHQGQFLQPQHFQHLDLFHQSSYFPLIKIANPYFWGVVILEINEGALENDVFEIIDGEFIMPEGTFVDFPDDAVIETRSFSKKWSNKEKPLKIYVGLKRLNVKGGNVTMVPSPENISDINTRFLTEAKPTEVIDYYQDGPSAQINTLNYVLKIFFEDELENASSYEFFQAAEVYFDGEKNIISKNYVPPCLHLNSSRSLLRIVSELKEELVSRTKQLEDYKTIAVGSSVEINPKTLPYRFLLQFLSQYTPLLQHYIATPQIHPFYVYSVVTQLIGALSSLSDSINFNGENSEGEKLFPAYNHEDIGDCFRRSLKLIRRLLNELTIETETVLLFEKLAQNRFTAEIPAEFFQNDLFLCLTTKKDSKEFEHSLLNYSKLGHLQVIDDYVERSLSGVSIESMRSFPEGVPRRPNTNFYKLIRNETPWKEVEQFKNIALAWDEAPADLKVELVSLKR